MIRTRVRIGGPTQLSVPADSPLRGHIMFWNKRGHISTLPACMQHRDMRSTSAEEQLAELQGAMASNILRYQKEILRLRQQLHERGGGGGGGAGGGGAQQQPALARSFG